MKTLLKTVLIALILTSFSTAAYAQKAKYNSLNKRMAILYKNGKNEAAIETAKEVIQVAEATFGKNHAYYTASLENLALLYVSEKKFTEAESLYEESLALREQLLGKEHPRLVKVLEKLATCYKETGKGDKAEEARLRIDRLEAMAE